MLPFAELDRCQDFLFDSVGGDDRVFIRPDSPLKLFTNQIATRDTFSADLEFIGFYEFPPNSLVVVSSPKTILNEWRFVVANGKVVAGCEYKQGDDLDYCPEYDTNAFDLAQSIAAIDYEPDPVWVMDICKTSDSSYHLLEIGGFSFADLYARNMADVVAAVSAAAKAVWQRKENIKSVNGSGQVFGFSTSTPSFTVIGCASSFASARPVTSNDSLCRRNSNGAVVVVPHQETMDGLLWIRRRRKTSSTRD